MHIFCHLFTRFVRQSQFPEHIALLWRCTAQTAPKAENTSGFDSNGISTAYVKAPLKEPELVTERAGEFPKQDIFPRSRK